MTKKDIIFFGNGPLADYSLEILAKSCNIIFHAKKKEDLETVKAIKQKNPSAHGILASFGVIIKSDILDLFEDEGILNIHPSLLPEFRGPSPIETAILRGDNKFHVSVMKLVKAMDAGPIYYQASTPALIDSTHASPEDKVTIYRTLAHLAASWIVERLGSLSQPQPQSVKNVTFCQKLDKSMSPLLPEEKSATTLMLEIRAFSGFPKSTLTINGHSCIILSASVIRKDYVPTPKDYVISSAKSSSAFPTPIKPSSLLLECHDGSFLSITELQPAGKKPMDAKSFINGYLK
ncbi:methionyl-tRNA formyltransferase [Candidatus Saccharibacteria bacterium]|nr:methionyl-tRNA formyltransferase [Candidatus Saccharibacteria bacterium]